VDGRLRIGACLSLSGKFARFGRQAALGLKAWQLLDGTAELLIEDDRSDRRTLEAIFPDVAARCDVLLGPYSTILTRTAGRVAAGSDLLVWNHGGSGDDVQQARPGHVISVLTPASRYAAPFIRYLADDDDRPRPLRIVHGPGKFGQQAAEGAATTAAQLGIAAVRGGPDGFPPSGLSRPWDLFSAGVFEQDARLASRALALPDPPRRLCTVSAGVREFARAAGDPEGVFGIAQWFPGSQQEVLLGPSEEEFLRACVAAGGGVPDYPAAQAAAGAVIAAHCAKLAGSSRGEDLWAAAASLDTTTLFGGFRIDPASGVQVKHDTVLVQWTNGEPRASHGSCQPTP
jgi:ABC-type branched-subunit amino acid transport system substrate-binding protein